MWRTSTRASERYGKKNQYQTEWKEEFMLQIPKNNALSIPSKVFNRILMTRMRDAVDQHLRDQQAGFEMSDLVRIESKPSESFWNNPWSCIHPYTSTL
ncbi:hypothetical protein DPMN_051083 [Dreissena polymorpha]|uniref:Reverse transcriptase domain-containing protein n=1 Tax=Dreissena polymorpha TaxID=45954 RepID=A0A9D4HPX3_DREPO|nr:hypothetical protein DPMN_051083 [Dreissena polymorpha]